MFHTVTFDDDMEMPVFRLKKKKKSLLLFLERIIKRPRYFAILILSKPSEEPAASTFAHYLSCFFLTGGY